MHICRITLITALIPFLYVGHANAKRIVLKSYEEQEQELKQKLKQKQKEDRPRWTVQIDPLTMALGPWHLQLEYAFADHHSIYVTPSIRLLDSPLSDEKYDAVGIETAYRYFWRGQAPMGPWAEARLVGSYLTTDSESKFGGYVSALGGYTWIFDNRYVLALGLGIQYVQLHVGDVGPEGILPAAHTAFGIAF